MQQNKSKQLDCLRQTKQAKHVTFTDEARGALYFLSTFYMYVEVISNVPHFASHILQTVYLIILIM